MPTQNLALPTMSEYGTLLVRVSTAGIALPVEGADVRIDGGEEENHNIHYLLTTDRSGLLERILLPTPPAALSLQPSGQKGFADYNIRVFKDGFYPVLLRNVPLFSGITSIQAVELIPWPSYNKDEYPPYSVLDFTESEPLFEEEER